MVVNGDVIAAGALLLGLALVTFALLVINENMSSKKSKEEEKHDCCDCHECCGCHCCVEEECGCCGKPLSSCQCNCHCGHKH
jgi:hypothetical protein